MVWEQNRQVPPVPLGWLIPVLVPSCCPSTAPWPAGQGSDQAGSLFLAIFALQTEQFSHPACSVAPQRAELAGILREAGILSLAFSFRTRLNQKKPLSVKATDRQDPSAAPDYLLFSKTCFLRKLLLK